MTTNNRFPSLGGRTGWVISDDKAGNEAQARGVFDALGIAYEIKRVAPVGIARVLAPYSPVGRREAFGLSGSAFAPPWPDFAIAAGRLTIPYVRALRRHARLATYTIVLLDPKTGVNTADLIWVPEHDRRRGANVITTVAAPHGFSPERLAHLRLQPEPPWLAALPKPRIAVLLGGNSKDYTYSAAAIARLLDALASLRRLGAGLMITPSRRSPPELAAAFDRWRDAGGVHFWDGGGDNPLPMFLAHAEHFVVPANSINMTGEPCATGRPVHVFVPDGGSAKFRRFHEALAAHGATRPLAYRFERLESWTYPPLFSASVIAAEIERRWSKRRQMLGGPASARGRDDR